MKIMFPPSYNFSQILFTSLPTLLYHSLCSFSFCLSFKEKEHKQKNLTKIKIKANKQKANDTKICQNEKKVHTHTHACTLEGTLGGGEAHPFCIGQLLLGIDPALACSIYPVHSAGENRFSF